MPNPFQRATKAKAKLRLALIGPSGSGKSYTSLLLAQRLAQASGGRVAVIDTERGSASLYADLFDFDVLELDTFSPDRYVKALEDAAAAGEYAAVVVDSLSHAWMGKGGALAMVDEERIRSKSGNGYVAWREVTPMHNRLVDAMLGSPLHVIATMRAKMEYVQEKDSNGRTNIRKIGLAPIQRDGLEFEFTVVADMDTDLNMVVSKTRIPAFTGKIFPKPDVTLADTMLTWLNSGADPQPPRQVISDPAVHASAPTSTNGHRVESLSQHDALTQMNGAARTVTDVRKGADAEALAAFGAVLKEHNLDAESACELLGIDTADGAKAALGRHGKARSWQTAQRELEARLILRQREADGSEPGDQDAEQPVMAGMTGGTDPADVRGKR